jgi:hypothetical protein
MGAAVAAAVVGVLGASLPTATWTRLSRRLVAMQDED